MVVIRPVTINDLDALYALAHETTFGLTTLPRDKKLLEQRINDSLHGFSKIDDKPRGECYLMVMEDITRGEVVGTCGIVSKVGGFDPFYAYRIETDVLESKMLNQRTEHRTLHLIVEHDGPCEIGSLFLKQSHRKAGVGRLLSLSRFLFIADHPQHFDEQVIAELRGVITDDGRSPFWDALGKHFFDMEFPKADYLSIVNNQFIGELMPRHPIYMRLLPATAQAVIGKVHEHTIPARRMLESEGFTYNNIVDIFEAGPVLSCPRDEIRSVRDSRVANVHDIVDTSLELPPMVIGNTRRDFRACIGEVALIDTAQVRIKRDVANTLKVNKGDSIRYVPLRPAARENA